MGHPEVSWDQFAEHMTWTCHGCGDERLDRLISVMSATTESSCGIPLRYNLRYCNDRPECAVRVREQLDELGCRERPSLQGRVTCDPDDVQAGQPARVSLTLWATGHVDSLVEPVQLRVILDAVPVVVTPVGRLVTLSVDRVSEPAEFEIVCSDRGVLPLVFRVYRESDSQLLVEITAQLSVG